MKVRVLREIRWPDDSDGTHIGLPGQVFDFDEELVDYFGDAVEPTTAEAPKPKPPKKKARAK